MFKTQSLILVCIFSLFSAAPVFAHAVGSADNSAQGLVKQAIAFLEGVHDADKARRDIQKAPLAIGGDLLNQDKLSQASTLLKQTDRSKMAQATVLLAQALGKDPRKTALLAFQPKYMSTQTNTILLVLAGTFIIIGAIILGKSKAQR